MKRKKSIITLYVLILVGIAFLCSCNINADVNGEEKCGENCNCGNVEVVVTEEQCDKACSCDKDKTDIEKSIEFSISSLIEQADIIAEVVVIEKVEEISLPFPQTTFRAKILDLYKSASSIEYITFSQSGNLQESYENHPIFVKDEKLIVFLKRNDIDNNENNFWIPYDLNSTIRVHEFDDEEYALMYRGKFDEFKSLNNVEMNQKFQTLLNHPIMQTFLKDDIKVSLINIVGN